MLQALSFALLVTMVASTPVYVMHVIIDDLGYNDVNFRNHQTLTPVMDEMQRQGVDIPEFYVYKSCSPSRASVLSGRYPWHVGYYNNNGRDYEGVPLDFDFLPAMLKRRQPSQWATHAIGKWHVGWMYRNYTPTYRGFDTFYGSSGHTDDYWGHFNAKTGCKNKNGVPIVDVIDFVDVQATSDDGGIIEPAKNVSGIYNPTLLTQRAVDIVQQHDASKSMYMYLAYLNVHVPMHAPLETVKMFPHTPSDARKVANAMLWHVDDGLGKIKDALQSRGMLAQTVFIVHTDNGGPSSHASNWPFRGGKFSFWEGGLRGLAFVSNPGGSLIPSNMRGKQFKGMAHLSDWYSTIADGIAGGGLVLGSTGPVPPDSVNLWPAITGLVSESPRKSVVHLPAANQYVDTSYCKKGPTHGCAPSMRAGRWKLLLSWPGRDSLTPLPAPSQKRIRFGKSGGVVRPGTNHAIGPFFKAPSTGQSETCEPSRPCLFDVDADPSESVNLASHNPAVVRNLKNMLVSAASTGPPLCSIVETKIYNKVYLPMACTVVKETGYWLPIDYNGAMPVPAPDPCAEAMEKACPVDQFDKSKKCRKCCKGNSKALKAIGCKRKDFNGHCKTAGQDRRLQQQEHIFYP